MKSKELQTKIYSDAHSQILYLFSLHLWLFTSHCVHLLRFPPCALLSQRDWLSVAGGEHWLGGGHDGPLGTAPLHH